MRFAIPILLLGVWQGLSVSASAQVTFMDYSGSATDDRVAFQRIGVTRGASNFAYWDDEVILPHLNRINSVVNVGVATPDGPKKDANAFLSDLYLNTGLETPGVGNGTSFGSTDQWTQITFDSPVVNSAGPDGFVATLQFLWVTTNLSPLMLSTSAGHSYVMPTTGGFAGSETTSLEQYLYINPVATPADLVNFTPVPSGALNRPSWVVQTFDLSSMGVADGATVSSLYLQDWSGNGNSVMPTFIAGFPAIPKLGDANHDGLVDGADYTVWADHFLQTTTLGAAAGDFNGSGVVDGADYTMWADHFAPLLLSAAAVPEPSSLALAACGACVLLAGGLRRRGQSQNMA